jgi:hypothetical protein
MSASSECEAARARYATAISIGDDYAFYFFAKAPFFDCHPKRRDLLSSLEHIRHCPECTEWVRAQTSSEVFDRFEHASKYCCIFMFCAVEEPERSQIQLRFTLYRGEDPMWFVNGTSAFFSYCPWCGARMPDKPFRDDVPKNA